MKSLSDDITIKLPTTGMVEGYVTTKIYANSIGVFIGRSYIPGDDSSLYVNVNDIAVQNRGKDDYLKLNDDGLVETVPLVTDTFGTYTYQRRWNIGQVGNYKVNITDNNNTYEDSEYVLTGYDYPNRDLKPTSMDEEDSSLCRIMQGCDWIYNHNEEIGSFLNLLLPHYPLVKTDKYGFGLQIGAGNIPLSSSNTPYSLRRDMGNEIELGSPIYGLSNTTFLTLDDLITGITGSDDNDLDVSIYLKQSDASNDEFGKLEDYIIADGWNTVDAMILKRRLKDSTGEWLSQAYTRTGSFENFRKYLVSWWSSARIEGLPESQYNNVDTSWWNIARILNDSNFRVYFYSSDSIDNTRDTLEAYADFYFDNATDYNDDELSQMYDYKLSPRFVPTIDVIELPDIYYGTCPVAILDRCYSRYYLAWNDRYGDIMSQPFDGKIEFSEDITKDEIMDYKMRRRVVHNELQPKWKLNTKWLNEDVYPMYESIFTSPYLLLYDTQTNRSWNVIVTDNKYTEKTYKNQKALFNLEITVEANTKENRIF